jgi:hypothetical protein
LFPVVEIVTTSEPEIALDPDQEPDAEQEVALVDDQVIVEVLVKRTFKGSAAIETRGAGVTGVVSPPPPPPPPPQPFAIRKKIKMLKLKPKILIQLKQMK